MTCPKGVGVGGNQGLKPNLSHSKVHGFPIVYTAFRVKRGRQAEKRHVLGPQALLLRTQSTVLHSCEGSGTG